MLKEFGIMILKLNEFYILKNLGKYSNTKKEVSENNSRLN